MATLYSREVVEKARELKAAGMRTSDIAKELGVHPSTVLKWTSGRLRMGKGTRIVFTPSQILEIRRLRAVEGLTQAALAERYGTNQGCIGNIVRGVTYRDVGGYILAPHCRDHSRKLSAAKARQIRRMRADNPGTKGVRRIARRFRVSKAMIYLVLQGKAWT